MKQKPVTRSGDSRQKLSFRKGIYILPNLFTCGNMSLGFLSVLSSVNGHFTTAAWFIVCAILCDVLDGRIARLTKTASNFGVQLDSLSDLVSFGVAPAMMMYELVLKSHELTHGKIGIAIAVLFLLCSALRLAKFNAQAAEGIVNPHFHGLPTPASAGVLISFVLSYELWVKINAPEELFQTYNNAELAALNFRSIPILLNVMPTFFLAMPIVMLLLSFLMVSNVPYLSFKHFHISRTAGLRILMLIIMLAILIIVYPQNIFFIIFMAYAVSGLVISAHHFVKKRRSRKRRRKFFTRTSPPSSEGDGAL